MCACVCVSVCVCVCVCVRACVCVCVCVCAQGSIPNICQATGSRSSTDCCQQSVNTDSFSAPLELVLLTVTHPAGPAGGHCGGYAAGG